MANTISNLWIALNRFIIDNSFMGQDYKDATGQRLSDLSFPPAPQPFPWEVNS